MRVPAGRRTTRITFQQRTGTQHAGTGAWTYTWADLASNPHELAEVQDVLPSRAESVADGINIQRRPARIRTLYRDDITSDMRVKIGDRVLEIVAGPAELGRREGLEMVCEELSTQGDEP